MRQAKVDRKGPTSEYLWQGQKKNTSQSTYCSDKQSRGVTYTITWPCRRETFH